MNELSFKVSSALKNIIGKDLITDDNIAIFELVKNSYDASATQVKIIFEKDKITVFDNGKGMSLDDIKNKWLFVAYSAKRDGIEDSDDIGLSQNQNYRDNIRRKHYAGAKGIGRFSCDRLGSHLILISRKKNTNFTEKIDVDWNEFEKSSISEFIQIMVQHETISNEFEFGTKLEISKLHSTWDRKKMQKLKHSLEKLINPFSSNEFEIEIECIDEIGNDDVEGLTRNKVNGFVGNFIFENLGLKTTQIKITVSKHWIISELMDRDALIYKTREANSYSNILTDVSFHIFYLNTVAKSNFTKQMGVDNVNFGSIFFFKNGFRVYPFGNIGDDSLGIDYRHQQGNRRFLGTRDLLGRIELFTDDNLMFKEVSSRDGGLVETEGVHLLIKLFMNVAIKPLERYLGFVQWGLGWDKKGYGDEKEPFRERDKQSEDISVIKGSLGSRAHYIEIIRKLSDNKNIEILDYNHDLISIIDNNLEKINPDVFRDLSKFATNINDPQLFQNVEDAEAEYNTILKQKIDTERKLVEEEQKRKVAEERAKIEEEARKKAEFAQKEAEIKKLKEEIARKDAEQKAKEEAEKRANAEKEKEVAVVKLEEEKKIRLFQSSIIGREKEQIVGLQHNIGHSSSRIITNANDLLRSKNVSEKELNKIYTIIKEATKIRSVSNFITRANFGVEAKSLSGDVVQFIKEYIEEIYLSTDPALKTNLNIRLDNSNEVFVMDFSPLEVTIIIDNFITNAEKANANEILFDFNISNDDLIFTIKDDGKGISNQNLDNIFDLGFTTTDGSGIGLFTIKSVIERDMGGFISVSSTENVGTKFRIELKK
ncbi:MAG: ATP-binding protein [Methanosarcinales archaeon]|jgi:signal transduction histidine kinase|nr:ATP-binding protein [Methanosarcinales archaeon]